MSDSKAGTPAPDVQERWRLLLDSTAEAILSITLDGVCTFCNATSLRLLGYQHECDLIGKNLHGVIHHSYPDGSPYPAQNCRTCQVLGRGEAVHVRDEVFWRRDGSSFPVEYHAAPQWKDGAVVGAVVTFLDVSERKEMESALLASDAERQKAEDGLRERKEFIEAVMDNLPIGFGVMTCHDRKVVYLNQMMEKVLGWPREILTDEESYWEHAFPDPEYRHEVRDKVYAARKHVLTAPATLEYRIAKSCGESAQIFTVYIPMLERDLLITTCQDITERTRATEKLRERNKFIETVTDNLPIGFGVVTADDGQLVYLNRKLEEIVGWPKEIIFDEKRFWERAFPDPAYREQMRELMYAHWAAGGSCREYRITKGNGEQVELASYDIPIPEENLLVVATLDLTERKRAEEALRQSELNRIQLQAELNCAAEVQKMLLPQGPLTLPGFEIAALCSPARQVGGDFYDWYETTPGIVTITFGDVMGKGMAAAMLMTAVRATLRAVTLRVQPSLAVQQAERSLRQDLDSSERFVTLFLARLNYEASLMSFVDCGHGYAFMRRRDGKVEELLPRGLPLGVSPGEEYIEGGCTFQGGDAVILYSDGLIDSLPDEALDNAILSGRLEGAASAGEMVRRIAELVPEGTPLQDDLTVLVVRRNLGG